MTTVADIVNGMGRIATTRQLLWAGAEEWHLTAAVRTQQVTRIRNGWYTTLPESDARVLAVRVGGRLTGISLIAHLGGWVIGRHPVHVAVRKNAARLRDPLLRRRRRRLGDGRIRVHWDARPECGDAMTVGLHQAPLRVVLDESFEQAVAALDWALHERLVTLREVADLLRDLPEALRAIVDWVDPLCESLPESLTRTRLRQAGLHVVSQVELPTGERIDLLVEGIGAVEVDGDRYHRDHFERDRLKDLTITRAGFHALRPSARAVFHHWPDVLAAVLALLTTSSPTFVRETQEFGGPRPVPSPPASGRRAPRVAKS